MAWQPCLRQSWHHRIGFSGKNSFSLSRLSLFIPYSLTLCLFVSDYVLVSLFLFLSSSPPPSRCSLSFALCLCTVTTERIASSGKWKDSHWRLHHCCQWSSPTHLCIFARLHHVNVQALPAPSQSLAEILH